MSSKVCDTRDLLDPSYRELADDFIRLSDDGSPDWRANNHVFRAWEYTYSYSQLDLGRARHLCDIGSENSLWPIWVKKRHPDLAVTCVEPNLDGRLRERSQLHGVDLEILGQSFNPGLGPFDRISCISVLEHVPSDLDVALVKDLAEALEPGGILVVTVDYGEADVPWPYRTVNVMGEGRMYGKLQVRNRIIDPSGLRLVVAEEHADFKFRELYQDVPGIDPMYVPYTSICLVLAKD